MRVYLAASFDRQTELKVYRANLPHGIVSTATWLDEEDSHSEETDDSPRRLNRLAKLSYRDFQDIESADAFVCFTEPLGTPRTRGSRHVELGIALALGKGIVCVGRRENLFYYDARVVQCADWHEAKLHLDFVRFMLPEDRRYTT